MHPVLFTVGSVAIRVHGLMIACGIGAGLLLLLWLARDKGAGYRAMLINFTTYAILGALVGARLWEMIWTWSAYVDRPWWARFTYWEGGMSIQGAVLGGLITALLYARIRRIDAWELVDLCAPALSLGQGLGRIGCLFEGDAFGIPVSHISWWPSWLGVIYAEGTPAWYAFGSVPLIPAEGLEAAADLAICAALLWYRPRVAFSGWRALFYGIAYSTVRFGLEFLRADSLLVGGWKVAQALSGAVILVCILLWAERRRGARPPSGLRRRGGRRAPGAAPLPRRLRRRVGGARR